MATILKNSLTLSGGTGVTLSNDGIDFDASIPIDQNITVGNDIRTTGKVEFNAVTSSGYDLSGYTLLSDRWASNFTAGGTIRVTGDLTIPGNASVGVNVTAEKYEAELTSSGTIFASGSTQFGDTIDDIHYFTGSIQQSGSFSLLGSSNITEFSNDTTLTDNSTTALTTESASKAYTDVQLGGSGEPTDTDSYLRKSYNKTASSVSNNTASFSAVTASAPESITTTSEIDFLFFNNGQAMEHDALQIQQSGSTFMLIANPSSLGYNLDNSDEIKAWGKFNA
jgi:hypothetical protein